MPQPPDLPEHVGILNLVTFRSMQAGVGGLPVYPSMSAQGGMHIPPDEVALMQSPMGPMPGMAGSPMMAPMPQQLASPLPAPGSEARLYVGAGKGVGEAALRHLFASIPGMLSCELQLDRTGHSRVRGRCAGLCTGALFQTGLCTRAACDWSYAPAPGCMPCLR